MGETDMVRQLLEAAALFFMNENEAVGLFGTLEEATARPNQQLFVTRAKEGATIITENGQISIEGYPVDEVDPTGAGDTFCGATLAGLAQGLPMEEACRGACRLAAQTVPRNWRCRIARCTIEGANCLLG